MKTFYIWNIHDLYQPKIDKFILENSKIPQDYEFKQVPANIEFKDLFNFLKTNNAYAVIHRNEHGVMWCTKEWISLTNKCIENGIPVLSFDFGYFNHYKSFMVDYYYKNCISSIYYKWNLIEPTFKWDSMPDYIKTYKKKVLDKVNFYKNETSPLNLQNIVVIWGQWTTELIKYHFYENEKHINMDTWMLKLIDIIKDKGFTPVIKMSPVKSLKWYKEIQHRVPTFVGTKEHQQELPGTIYEEDINYKLIAHAKYHIINCSSVSNELVLSDSKVIAMGRSWFDNLNVFYEPKNWDNILNYQQPSPENINKWLNWWRYSQCTMDDLPSKLIQLRESIKL